MDFYVNNTNEVFLMIQKLILKMFESKLFKKLAILYLLNVVDWVCTLVLLATGYFMEVNPFMQPIMENLALGIFVKCLLPLLLIVYINIRLTYANEKQLKTGNHILSVALIIYTLIIILHVANFTFLIFLT